jgi:endonuclease/exonuclease/phosphatase family metal-dependent hydrolase
MTIARVVGALEANQKKVLIRRESASSFSDLRQGAVVLIGAFNNEWSLRLTHPLRYSLALDPDHHLVYI